MQGFVHFLCKLCKENVENRRLFFFMQKKCLKKEKKYDKVRKEKEDRCLPFRYPLRHSFSLFLLLEQLPSQPVKHIHTAYVRIKNYLYTKMDMDRFFLRKKPRRRTRLERSGDRQSEKEKREYP